ncbi:MAG: hypothetical protein LBB90_06910 [Tannerella sp.]|jgi:hypothetical protein|nr:hypothetical protein [Tannerella sp.]
MNSPWGVLWILQKETGWTDDYILWGVSWANLQMKLADAPHYAYGHTSAKRVDGDELVRLLEQQNR